MNQRGNPFHFERIREIRTAPVTKNGLFWFDMLAWYPNSKVAGISRKKVSYQLKAPGDRSVGLKT